MQVNASDIVGKYQVKIQEVGKVIETLLESGESQGDLLEARSDAAALQAHFNLLLFKYQEPVETFLLTGNDSKVNLDELETNLVTAIEEVYEGVAAAVRH